MKIPIARPYLGDDEKRVVLSVMESGCLTSGDHVAEFEARFAEAHGAEHGVAMSSGTTALMAALMAHGIGPGDEVIVPSFTFFASASSVLAVGARPIFADIDANTYNLSAAAAEAAITPRTRAIMPVHLYGLPADLPRFRELCDARGLCLLEDAAQAHLAGLDDRHVGTWGTAAFSFHPSKNMTTMEGGMVLTSDGAVARRLRLIRNQGMETRYLHEVVGCNFRMMEVCGAIGVCQLGRLPVWTEQRMRNARYYDERLSATLRRPFVPNGYRHVYHQYTVRAPAGADRDAIVETLKRQGVDARAYYRLPVHRQPAVQARWEGRAPELPETERACREVFSLPVHPWLTPEERDYVVREVNAVCGSGASSGRSPC